MKQTRFSPSRLAASKACFFTQIMTHLTHTEATKPGFLLQLRNNVDWKGRQNFEDARNLRLNFHVPGSDTKGSVACATTTRKFVPALHRVLNVIVVRRWLQNLISVRKISSCECSELVFCTCLRKQMGLPKNTNPYFYAHSHSAIQVMGSEC